MSGPEVIISTENITDHFRDFIEQAIDKGISLDCSWRVIVPDDREVRVGAVTGRVFEQYVEARRAVSPSISP